MRALFFCSAAYDIDPKYNEAARGAVRAACLKGYGIVSGGTVKGTMGVVAGEAAACGVPNRGVLPRFMAPVVHPGLSETVWTDTMSERKELMREGADVVIALPGGIGTMDELFETLVLAKLGRFSGRIIALNLDGFYDPLETLLDHFVAQKMMTAEEKALLHLPRSVEELEALL